ncbi:MAG: hypothetical protein LBF38_08760 [Deltaproteobacteria bacterium]|jgi:hypothetical protein|nr:hypothetical protein [Deltaproteobacteria bacterium]
MMSLTMMTLWAILGVMGLAMAGAARFWGGGNDRPVSKNLDHGLVPKSLDDALVKKSLGNGPVLENLGDELVPDIFKNVLSCYSRIGADWAYYAPKPSFSISKKNMDKLFVRINKAKFPFKTVVVYIEKGDLLISYRKEDNDVSQHIISPVFSNVEDIINYSLHTNYTVFTNNLVKEFMDNPSKADKKYFGNVIAMIGTVDKVKRSKGKIRVNFKVSGNRNVPLKLTAWVQDEALDNALPEVSGLKTGDLIYNIAYLSRIEVKELHFKNIYTFKLSRERVAKLEALQNPDGL